MVEVGEIWRIRNNNNNNNNKNNNNKNNNNNNHDTLTILFGTHCHPMI